LRQYKRRSSQWWEIFNKLLLWWRTSSFRVDWGLFQVWADIEAKKNPDNLTLFGSHWSPLYGEKSWNVFIKNLNFFSTEERTTWISWMTWGVS